MEQLSGLDATFLYLETAEMPMHVGALALLELPPGSKMRYTVALRRHIAQRLPQLPALRRKLWWMPLNMANPAWVDAAPDLQRHVVEVKLPKGAGMAELETEVARLHAQRLDRERPLWKFHVLEGLANGPEGQRRVAVYTQFHHAAVDGQAAVALASQLFDLTPEAHPAPPRPARRPKVYRLEMVQMLRGVLGNQAQKVAEIVRGLPSTVGTLKTAAAKALAQSRLLGGGDGQGIRNLTLAPRTRLNASITAGRRYATASLPLAELRELGRAQGATVNDLVLAVCSGALRRSLARRRELPRKSLVAAVPVSLREAGDARADNQATLSLVSLGTNIADPAQRLAHVQAAAAAMKAGVGSVKSILPTDFPSLGMPWLIEAAAALYGRARIAERIPLVANLVISNVPGPQQPLYLAGARMVADHPASIVVHGMALNITVQSYDGRLDFGLVADAAALPEPRELARDIVTAWDDLRRALQPEARPEPRPEGPAPVAQAARRPRRA
ncbi:MAG: wax ester/triacylglycerol synthase family O-acyltransferase, partial [Burkholderiales bacterium]|nr:wax ester/triacylglycerol synthase family O-acyltransferase [Burkholderiales bacterium]